VEGKERRPTSPPKKTNREKSPKPDAELSGGIQRGRESKGKNANQRVHANIMHERVNRTGGGRKKDETIRRSQGPQQTLRLKNKGKKAELREKGLSD